MIELECFVSDSDLLFSFYYLYFTDRKKCEKTNFFSFPLAPKSTFYLFTGFTNIPQYPENDTTSRSYEKTYFRTLVQISFFPSPLPHILRSDKLSEVV